MKTKDFLLLEAYKLFATKPYDKVTFVDLENATKLSRGAILYHIKNKELLFQMVIEQYLLSQNSIQPIVAANPTISLKQTIDEICLLFTQKKEEKKDIGIINMNLALLNMERDAFYIFPELRQKTNEWCVAELDLWKQILEKALAGNEIKPDIDIDTVANMFFSIYLGVSYRGTVQPKGFDLKLMKKEFLILYKLIKK